MMPPSLLEPTEWNDYREDFVLSLATAREVAA